MFFYLFPNVFPVLEQVNVCVWFRFSHLRTNKNVQLLCITWSPEIVMKLYIFLNFAKKYTQSLENSLEHLMFMCVLRIKSTE